MRPGGVAADLPDGWEDDVLVICDTIYERTFEYDELLTGQPIFRNRMVGRRAARAPKRRWRSASRDRCCARPACAWDLRRSMPYLAYDEVEFDVIVGTYGDNFDRYAIRLNEIRESVRIVRQCLEKHAARATTAARTPRSRRRRARASTSRWRR